MIWVQEDDKTKNDKTVTKVLVNFTNAAVVFRD